MSPVRIGLFAGVILIAALGAHLAWSAAVAYALSSGYQHRVFDVRRWEASSDRGAVIREWQVLLGGFFDLTTRRAAGQPTVAFMGSSFTFGYPWQQAVIFTKKYADAHPSENVFNASVVGANLLGLNDWVICSAYRQGATVDLAVVEIPVVNALGHLGFAYERRTPLDTIPPIASCGDRHPVHGYFGFIATRAQGLGWLQLVWDNEAYTKPEQAINLGKVPHGYFVAKDVYEPIADAYREQVAQVLSNVRSVARTVYAYPSPIYLPGVSEIGEDAATVRRQLDATIAICRSMPGIRCLDPQRFYPVREYYYNLTHLNRLGHSEMGSWLDRELSDWSSESTATRSVR